MHVPEHVAKHERKKKRTESLQPARSLAGGAGLRLVPPSYVVDGKLHLAVENTRAPFFLISHILANGRRGQIRNEIVCGKNLVEQFITTSSSSSFTRVSGVVKKCAVFLCNALITAKAVLSCNFLFYMNEFYSFFIVFILIFELSS